MWERWFRSWFNAVFWWLPRSEERPREEPPQRHNETAAEPPPPAAEPQAEPAAAAPASAEATVEPSGEDAGLTDISGIGPAMQRNLEAAGITTVSQLAAADAEELTAKLKSSRRSLSRPQVQRWIDAARERL